MDTTVNNTTKVLGKVSPSITKMIRTDHSHVMLTSHKFTASTSLQRKRAIVRTICLALDIHAQLEEEIFYPALREVAPDNEILAKSKPEHDEMRRRIGELRDMPPEDESYATRFCELMRDVMHHVADEEAVLLPMAERLLAERLGELGARMTQRRLQLIAPHAGEIAVNNARAMPAGTMLLAGSLLAGAYMLGRGREYRRH